MSTRPEVSKLYLSGGGVEDGDSVHVHLSSINTCIIKAGIDGNTVPNNCKYNVHHVPGSVEMKKCSRRVFFKVIVAHSYDRPIA